MELVNGGRACLIGLIRQEILSGIRSQAQFEKIRMLLRSFVDVPVSTSDYEAAAAASNHCKSKGITASVVDCLICTVAQTRSLAIFTTDEDFDYLARLLPIRLHKVRR